jgi:hypothetical protein
MEHVLKIRLQETVSVDQDRLGALYAQMGETGAEDVVCRAMEELALRLAQCSRLYRAGNWGDLRKCTRSLIAIADQIGMTVLSRVAQDVTDCVDRMDETAVAATLARLIRIGDQSLSAIWDLQDITI